MPTTTPNPFRSCRPDTFRSEEAAICSGRLPAPGERAAAVILGAEVAVVVARLCNVEAA